MNEAAAQPENPPVAHPCPVCGGTTYAWGYLRAQNLAVFFDDDAYVERPMGLGSRLRVRLCTGCRNVQLFDVVE